jgi:hypothetical protein
MTSMSFVAYWWCARTYMSWLVYSKKTCGMFCKVLQKDYWEYPKIGNCPTLSICIVLHMKMREYGSFLCSGFPCTITALHLVPNGEVGAYNSNIDPKKDHSLRSLTTKYDPFGNKLVKYRWKQSRVSNFSWLFWDHLVEFILVDIFQQYD